MVGIYFSGTGNTKHCIDRFLNEYGEQLSAISIEDSTAAVEAISQSDLVVFAYPVYYSNLPKIVRDFIIENQRYFRGKKIYVIATMALFSGDGAGCAARLFKTCGAEIIGGLHLKMPDCIGDVKVLKRTREHNKQIVRETNTKIANAVRRLKSGNPHREGLSVLYHVAGLILQRIWFFNKTKQYSNKLRIDALKCFGCGLCKKICPVSNIELRDGKAHTKEKCTLCYRCVNNCPHRAITLLGKKVYEQCRFEYYDA